MSNSLPNNGSFNPSEMIISNQAYRDFLLRDERGAFNEDGSFNDVAEIGRVWL